jgi:DNA-binding response OmpR family regulator
VHQARFGRPSAIVLDLTLPKVDGYEVLRTLRQQGNRTPILILTSRATEVEKLKGFQYGADDYVTKPFSILEVLARLEVLIRRSPATADGSKAAGETARFGAIELRSDCREVLRDGVPVPLRPKEYELLMALVEAHGAVVSRHELLRLVWGMRPDVVTRTVDIHVAELRRKLEDDPAHPKHILTVRKVGYRLAS